MPRAGLSQADIIEDASRFINEFGLEQLSLGKLARRLNIKPPSLYNHISSLDALKDQLTLKALSLLKQDLLRVTVAKSHEDALLDFAFAYRNFALENPGLFQATLRNVEDKQEAIKKEGHDILELILSILKGFGLEGERALHATRSLRANLAGFIILELNEGFAMPINSGESFAKHVRGFIRSLSNF